MTPRFKALLLKVIITLLFVVAIVTFFAAIIFINIDNLTLSIVLFLVVSTIVFYGATRFVLNTEETKFDKNGITSFRFNEDNVFCSWTSITKVEVRNLPRVGKMVFIYNDKYTTFSPFEIKSAKHDAISLVYTSEFIDALRLYRPDLELNRID